MMASCTSSTYYYCHYSTSVLFVWCAEEVSVVCGREEPQSLWVFMVLVVTVNCDGWNMEQLKGTEMMRKRQVAFCLLSTPKVN